MRAVTQTARWASVVLLFLLSACGGGSGGSKPTVATVSVSPATASVVVGATQQLTPTGKTKGGKTVTDATFTFSSSSTAIATVSSTGLVTAVAVGTATITVTAPPVATVSVTPATASLLIGATQQLTPTAKDSRNNTIATATFTYSSSSTATATVSSSGLVTAVAAGTATITVTSESKTATSTITVTAPPPVVASVTVSPSSASLTPAATQQLTPTAKDAGSVTIPDATFTYASSNTAVATVSSSGLVTAVAVGTATITVTSGSVNGTAAITVNAATAVTGTAATGAPIANTTITLVDSDGTTATATTGTDGTFSINSSGLTPPFMLQIVLPDTTKLYSVSADANNDTVINVDPLTDLIIRTWYQVKGENVDTAFANPTGSPPPTPTEVKVVNDVVLVVVQLWLENEGVDTTDLNLISAPFAANSSGRDKVLDTLSVDTSGAAPVVTIKDDLTTPTTTQTTTLTLNSTDSSIKVDTTTETGTGTSTSSTTTTVPTSDALVTAFQEIQSSLNTFADLITSKGSALTVDDVAPFFSPDILDQGLSQADALASLITDVRGLSISLKLKSVDSLDTTNGTGHATFYATISDGTNSSTELAQFYFVKSGDTWLVDGDQLIANVDVQAEMRTNQGAYSQGSGPAINVDVEAPEGFLTGFTVTGAGVFDNTASTTGSQRVRTFEPTPGATEDHIFDAFWVNQTVANLVPAGTIVTVNLMRAAGGTVSYEFPLNAFTTEPISITAPTASSMADAKLGQDLAVQWTLPTTFAVAEVRLSGWGFTGQQDNPNTLSCETERPILSKTATSGTVVIPADCQGQAVVRANINLSVLGVNGERTVVVYEFADTP